MWEASRDGASSPTRTTSSKPSRWGNLFRGRVTCRTEFKVTLDAADEQKRLGFAENDPGIGNRMTLLDDEWVISLNDVQLRNVLPPTASLASRDFTVEMEKGTGRIYDCPVASVLTSATGASRHPFGP